MIKTLKDLKEKYEKIREENRRERLNSISSEVKFDEAEGILKGLKLSKQEAIKCFKKLEKLKESHYFDKKDFFQNNFQENPVVLLRFIEWFFNITEKEALK